MNQFFTAAVALLVLLATAGTATALPGEAIDQADREPGPPSGLPDVVPDFVSDILGTVGDVLGGVIDDIGAAVSDVATGFAGG